MTKGFLIDRVRNNNAYFNTKNIEIEVLADIPFFYDELLKESGELISNFDKWKEVLGVKDAEELSGRVNRLLTEIALAKRTTVSIKEREIASTDLSSGRIAEFKEMVGKAWNQRTRIRRIFKAFNNKTNVTGDDVKLMRVGQRAFFEKAKMMFIEGKHYQQIYGVEQFGGNIGGWEDTMFFEIVLKGKEVEDSGLALVIDRCLAQLRNQGTAPTAIIVQTLAVYQDKSFTNSEKFEQTNAKHFNPDNVTFFLSGTYDGIQIFSSESSLIENKVVVCNFESAFEMRYKANSDWFENELSVEIEQITEEEAAKKLLNEPEKWIVTNEGVQLSDADALILIKTSIIIDCETIIDFRIKDSNKYIIGRVVDQNKV
jgi:hypothetical protein